MTKDSTSLTELFFFIFQGVVRFISKRYTYQALEYYRTSEIVVQDVAVSVLLLKANMSQNERRGR